MNNLLTYLIKTIVLNVIRKAIRIPKMIDKNVDDDEVCLLSSIDGNGIKRDEQRASIENTFGGGPILNTGGGGGKWEQC